MPNYRSPFRLIRNHPEGTCPECALAHPPEDPHNRDSLFYQYRFYEQHGRWPTWDDAMAHVAEERRAAWQAALAEVLASRGLRLENGVPVATEETDPK